MNSFVPGVLERQVVPASLLHTMRLIGEYRVRQETLERASPRVLDSLRRAARVRSIEAFARSVAPLPSPARLAALVTGQVSPEHRAEEEIAGFCEALRSVARDCAAADDSSPRIVLDLHADLYRFVPEGGGRWTLSDDLVTETLPDGSTAVIFTPVPAYAVEAAMVDLHDGFTRHAGLGVVDRVLLVASYLLDFVCIHPFAEGNGPMLGLLARLLLARGGFRVGAFVSLDALLDETRVQGAAALQASWRDWHRSAHNLAPWWEYFAGVLLQAYRQFEHGVQVASPPRGAKRDMVLDAVGRLPRDFRYVDLERLLPAVSRPTINRALRGLRARRQVACVRPGRNARWQRID